MIIYNPDIEDTEAAIISTPAGKECRIIKLAGGIGEICLWLEGVRGNSRKLGINMSVIASGANMIEVSSLDIDTPLRKNDRVAMHFHGGGALHEAFLIGGIKIRGMRKNFLVISNMHASMLLERDISRIEVCNVKAATAQVYRFLPWGSCQYKSQEEGSKLFRIMLKRLLTAKVMMAEQLVV